MTEAIRRSSATEESQRGREAEAILSHPMISEALDAIERSYMNQWAGSAVEDAKSREYAYRMFRSAQDFRALLTSFVESGKLVAIKADEERRQKASLED